MNKQKLSKTESQLWAHLRKIGDVAVDYPGRKVGMPSAIPYEGVGFPVEIDGNFTFVTIPVEIVTEFAHALIACVPESISQDCELDAKREADIAISRVKGY